VNCWARFADGALNQSKPVKRRPQSLLYDKARDRARLWSAWEVVNRNAKRSKATNTREEAKLFQQNLRLNIERIARALQKGTFKFKPQRAVAIPKAGGKKRPLIVAPIDNRIVQRALLDTLQEIPSIRAKLASGLNFGGVDEKGVPDAIKKVAVHAESHPYFIRTDISGFFQNVRRQEALNALLDGIAEEPFRELVTNAATTELDAATKHLADTGIFPLQEEGVQQGSCLSPLLCNVLLHPFDLQMNARNVVTVRYIDDFILLAKSEHAARKAFDSAKRWLAARGLGCYDPFNPADSKKAEHGSLRQGSTFLGCDVSMLVTRPSKENIQDLKDTISASLEHSIVSMKNPSKAQADGTTFAETLIWVSDTVRGWANTFGFCTDERRFADIDRDINEKLSDYESRFIYLRSKMNPADARRVIGVFPMCDRKRSEPKDRR
jgi:RNA-directed DNA polymerase